MIYQGRVWKFGDNIDTDAIIPARYLNTSDPGELAAHCMEDADPEFVSKIKPGDIILGGENFGCGSSREHAPSPSKLQAFPALSLKVLPAFSTVILLTWDCLFLNQLNCGQQLPKVKKFAWTVHWVKYPL